MALINRQPTVFNMCDGCKREKVVVAWVPMSGEVVRKVCEAYENPASLMSARHGTRCIAYSDGKERR